MRLHPRVTAGPRCDRTEKYGRYLARIMNADGIDVGEQLLAEGLAVSYEGGRR